MEGVRRTRRFALYLSTALAFGLGLSTVAAAVWNRSNAHDSGTRPAIQQTSAVNLQPLFARLQAISNRIGQEPPSSPLWQLEMEQAQVLFLLAHYTTGEECDNYVRMGTDSLYTAAVQSPEDQSLPRRWLAVLPDQISRSYPGNPLTFHAARLGIQLEYDRELTRSTDRGVLARQHLCQRLEQLALEQAQAPEAPKTLLDVGRTWETMQRFVDAERCYQELAARFPDSALVHTARKARGRLSLPGQSVRIDLPPLFCPADNGGQPFNWKELHGQLVAVYFWTSRCPQAASDFQALCRTSELYGDRDVQVVYVNLDADAEQARRFLDTRLTNGVHLYDKQGLEGAVAERFGLDRVPQAVLIDRRGVVLRNGLSASQVQQEVYYQLLREQNALQAGMASGVQRVRYSK